MEVTNMEEGWNVVICGLHWVKTAVILSAVYNVTPGVLPNDEDPRDGLADPQ